MIRGCGPDYRLGVVGITGTALTNGIGLALTFADKVIARVANDTSGDEGVKYMKAFSQSNFSAI
jgi:hypothetical protein